MVKALCKGGAVASPRGDVRSSCGRVAAAESPPPAMGGYRTRTSFPAGRVAITDTNARLAAPPSAVAQMNGNLTIGKAMRWWEKGAQPNMREVESAHDLADSLLSAGDKLVVVDFFSPGCGGCRALHPKIAQLAERNPEVVFLQVNYEQHKSMCYSLHVHVLPFFRFYRGAQGRVSSFTCTNATINKFKVALGKHGPDRCGLGPARGLEESELVAMAANRDLDFTHSKKPTTLVPIADAIDGGRRRAVASCFRDEGSPRQLYAAAFMIVAISLHRFCFLLCCVVMRNHRLMLLVCKPCRVDHAFASSIKR